MRGDKLNKNSAQYVALKKEHFGEARTEAKEMLDYFEQGYVGDAVTYKEQYNKYKQNRLELKQNVEENKEILNKALTHKSINQKY